MRYLKNRPNQVWDNISYIMWPRYAASNIFFSSTLDNILPQVEIFYYSPNILKTFWTKILLNFHKKNEVTGFMSR